jgi:hypothetical protein
LPRIVNQLRIHTNPMIRRHEWQPVSQLKSPGLAPTVRGQSVQQAGPAVLILEGWGLNGGRDQWATSDPNL